MFRQTNVSVDQEDGSVPHDYSEQGGSTEEQPTNENWPFKYQEEPPQYDNQGH